MNRKIPKKRQKPGPKKREPIRPPQTEAEIKEDIMMLAAASWSEDEIARVMGLEHKDLKAKYQHELEFGPLREKALLIKSLKRKAHTGDVSAIRLLISLGDESSFLRKGIAERRGAGPRPMQPVKPEKEIKKKIAKTKPLGKKVEDLLAAQKGHKGTSWEDHLKH